MMTDFATSKTKENLEYAFAGESKASIKYSYFAKQAGVDGYQQINSIFAETSGNERTHAKMWFRILHSEGAVPGKMPDTLANLNEAADGEYEEWSDMYKNFAEVARAEGFDKIADKFAKVGHIEKEHEERYRKLIKRIEAGEVFKRGKVYAWKCLECGNIHMGEEPPVVCPVCDHPQAYYELRAENF